MPSSNARADWRAVSLQRPWPHWRHCGRTRQRPRPPPPAALGSVPTRRVDRQLRGTRGAPVRSCEHRDHRRHHGRRRHAERGRPAGRRALPRHRPMFERVSPRRRQHLRDRLRDAAAQGLERPLLPPGQRRHRRQRGPRHRQLNGGGGADQRAAAGLCRPQLGRRPRRRAGPGFGIDPQARLDYGYQAVAKLTPMAKAAIAAAYGKGPDRSYFGGCSNGGRHTLVAAARYADEYDGFLAGAPGLQPAAGGDRQHLRRAALRDGAPRDPAAAGLATAFTTAERTTGGQRRAGALRRARRRHRRPGAGHAAPARRRSTSTATCPPAPARATAPASRSAQKIAIARDLQRRHHEQRRARSTRASRTTAASAAAASRSGSSPRRWCSTRARSALIFKVPPENPAALQRPGLRARPATSTRCWRRSTRPTPPTPRSAMWFMTPPDPTRHVDAEEPRRQDHGLPRRQRPDLLGRRHRGLVRRHLTRPTAATPPTSRASTACRAWATARAARPPTSSTC